MQQQTYFRFLSFEFFFFLFVFLLAIKTFSQSKLFAPKKKDIPWVYIYNIGCDHVETMRGYYFHPINLFEVLFLSVGLFVCLYGGDNMFAQLPGHVMDSDDVFDTWKYLFKEVWTLNKDGIFLARKIFQKRFSLRITSQVFSDPCLLCSIANLCVIYSCGQPRNLVLWFFGGISLLHTKANRRPHVVALHMQLSYSNHWNARI